MKRIEHILQNAKEQSENYETEYNHTLEDAYTFGIDGKNKGTGVSDKSFSEDESESISGKCPECSERRSLSKKQDQNHAEIYCEACETELLEYRGEQTVTGVNFYEEIGGHSISFTSTG